MMFLNLIHVMKIKNEVVGSLVNHSLPPDDLNLDLNALSLRVEKMVEAMTLSLEVEDDSLEKTMKTLNPKGVFIGFPSRLK